MDDLYLHQIDTLLLKMHTCQSFCDKSLFYKKGKIFHFLRGWVVKVGGGGVKQKLQNRPFNEYGHTVYMDLLGYAVYYLYPLIQFLYRMSKKKLQSDFPHQ